MSYQAITDIIVNQNQFSDLQLSTTVKDSPQQTNVSFADILASYSTEEPATPDAAASENQNVSAESDAVSNVEKPEEKSAEAPVEKENKTEEVSEKPVEKADTKDSEKKIDDKKTVSDKSAAKSEQKLEVKDKTEVSETSKKDGKQVKNGGKDKKLTEQDFSRMQEISERAENIADSAKTAAAATNAVKLEKQQDVKTEPDTENAELIIAPDASGELLVNQLGADNKSETSDFDFSGKNEGNSKKFALGKDGKITVEDQRTKFEPQTQVAEAKKSAIKTSEIKLTNDSTAVMTVEMNPNAEADVLSLNTQTAASNGSNFQAMLSNQLSNVAPEFVKAGNLVLKDNNQGTINLVLHPDDLGNVKIHLSLDGKTLSGHITVATKEALQVFKDNAETLREAFIKSGFDSASFDVAMNNGGSSNQNFGFEGQNDGTNLFARRGYGSSAGGLSAELDSILENAEDISNYSVNIVA